ncbi:MAG: hypothetical protein ACKOCH_21905, partial [Bacteroidota bacterium]
SSKVVGMLTGLIFQNCLQGFTFYKQVIGQYDLSNPDSLFLPTAENPEQALIECTQQSQKSEHIHLLPANSPSSHNCAAYLCRLNTE